MDMAQDTVQLIPVVVFLLYLFKLLFLIFYFIWQEMSDLNIDHCCDPCSSQLMATPHLQATIAALACLWQNQKQREQKHRIRSRCPQLTIVPAF